MTSSPYSGIVKVASSKATVPSVLNPTIINIAKNAITKRNKFTMALSGGSLPSFLATLKDYITDGDDLQFNKWYIILADERCVPITDSDSNLGSIQEKLLKTLTDIPSSQIYGINETLLNDVDALAYDYEAIVKSLLKKEDDSTSMTCLDLAVLGFGPDGHTCSLFPNHELLKENTKLVASIKDSPKPPPNRITLTFPVLNELTRNVIFCGAGSSKGPILDEVFTTMTKKEGDEGSKNKDETTYDVIMNDPPPYPCGMVRPKPKNDTEDDNGTNRLIWVIDADAMPKKN